MKMSLKIAMQSAESGCLCGKQDIIHVLQNLLSTPISEFPQEFSTNIRKYLSCTHGWLNEIDDEKFGQYTYLDILCLSDTSIDILEQETPDCSECISLYSETLLLQFLKKTSEYCTWASLFGSISVEALLNVLDDLAKRPHNSFKELLEITDRLSDHWINYSITPTTTVGELMNQTEDVIKQFWRPWHDLDKFAEHVNVGYDVMNLIVFKCIKNAFHKHFKAWAKEVDIKCNVF